MSKGDLILVRFDIGQHRSQVLGWKVLPSNQDHWHVGHQPDRLKGGDRIIGELWIERRCCGMRHIVEEDRIAIASGPGRLPSSDGPTCTSRVLHDKLLLE